MLRFVAAVGGGENDYSFAGLESEIGLGGVDLAALGDRDDNAAGRPVDVGDAASSRGRVR
jgi:hypothetical protein